MEMYFEAANSAANKASNKALKQRYDADPRIFHNQNTTKAEFPEFIITFAIFIFSLLSASANCERAFSCMGWLVAGRRARITAENVDKRLTLANQLPQKKRLLAL